MKCNLDFLHFLIFITFVFLYTSNCVAGNVEKSIEDNLHDEEMNEEGKEDSMDIASDLSEPAGNVSMCTRLKNSQMHEIRSAKHNQFPFMAAIMSPRHEYVCAGSIIANGLILTTAQCTESASYVLVNTTKDKKDNTTISLHITKSEVFPTYTGPNSVKNAAIIYTEKHNNTLASKIKLSNLTSSSNLSDIEAIGFGLNAEVGQVKELQFVGLDARDTQDDSIKGFIDCINTKVLTCFKDKGGPIVFDKELVGIITVGQDECTNEIVSTYAINKFMVNALPIYTIKAWLDEKIAKNAEQRDEMLPTYPKKPILRTGASNRRSMERSIAASGGVNKTIMPLYYSLILLCLSS